VFAFARIGSVCPIALALTAFSSFALERYPGLTEAIQVTPTRGFYFTPISVTVFCPTAEAGLAITLDGSEPIRELATAPNRIVLRLTNTTVLRARAFRTDWQPSPAETHTYILPQTVAKQQAPPGAATFWQDRTDRIAPDWEIDARIVQTAQPGYEFTNSLLALPTISLAASPQDFFGAANGIYVHSLSNGPAWIRPGSVEWIYPDGRAGFQRDAGLRIRGGASRFPAFSPKHGFGLVFRKEFGPGELDFPAFSDSPRHRFSRLVLRPNVNDSWASVEWPQQRVNGELRWTRAAASYIRDQWVRDAQRAMGQASAHGDFVHLYLNGLYWGVYNLAERPDDDLAAAYFGGREQEYDVVSDGPDLHAGNWTAWRQLLRADGLSNSARYQRLLGNTAEGKRDPAIPILIDVTNLVDYMILHIFIGADDWPDHNWWVARRRGDESTGFKFLAWDQEVSLNSLVKQHTGWVLLRGGAPFYAEERWPNTPAEIYSHCRANPEFRRLFAARIQQHLFGTGALSVSNNIARWKRLASRVDRALVAESARWGDPYRPEKPFRREVEWLAVNEWECKVFFPSNHIIALKRFRDAKLLPSPAE